MDRVVHAKCDFAKTSSSMSLIGRSGADGCVASIVSSLIAADHLVEGAGAATAQS